MREFYKLADRVSLEKSKRAYVDFFTKFLNLVAVFLRDYDPIKSNHLLKNKF